jgi:4-amino-4-deoxy-L-arabinose transferase-like glycosyltransferase
VLLLCSSPWFVFMAMNFMSHNFSLTCALVAALAVSWARKTGNKIWALLGGFSAGILGLVRPLDGLVIAAILGLWGAGLGGQRLKITALGAFVIGCIATNSIVLPYNKAVTGDSILSPLTAYYNQYHGAESNAFGFGPNRGLGWAIDPLPGHSPMEALINANLNTFSINVELFGWSTGSLILIVMLLFCQRLQRSDYLMLAATVGIVAAYSFYWFSGGPDFGARYWYLTVVPLTVLTARGIQFVSESLERGAYNQEPRAQSNDFPLSATSFQNVRVIVGVASLCVFALANYFPWRAIDKYYHYLGMRPDIRNLARQHEFGKSLVLIRGKAHPDYASAWIYNSWNSNNDRPVYAWDRNPEARAKVIEAYPDRLVWLVDGPTITNGSFKLIDGPRRAHELSPPASAFLRPTE